MNRIKKIEMFFSIAIFMMPVLFVLFLVIAQWPNWWKWIIFERSPMTWLESILLFSVALVSALLTTILYLAENKGVKRWALFSMFFLVLTFDERFAIHERIRDSLLTPAGIKLDLLFWVAPGDYILLIILIVGLFFLKQYIDLFKSRKSALYCFLGAVIFSTVAVFLDSIDVHNLNIGIQRIEQFVEELIETGAMLFFLQSVALILFSTLSDVLKPKGEKADFIKS